MASRGVLPEVCSQIPDVRSANACQSEGRASSRTAKMYQSASWLSSVSWLVLLTSPSSVLARLEALTPLGL